MDEKAEARATRDDVVIRLPNPFTWLQDVLPPDFRTHMRAAQREQLLAVRSLIDAAIERMDEADKGSHGRVRTEITVE